MSDTYEIVSLRHRIYIFYASIKDINSEKIYGMTIKVYYLSDLHLEYLPETVELESFLPTTDTSSDLLILAGDIGSPFKSGLREFLMLARSRFTAVIYIPGNHEFWNHRSMAEIQLSLQVLCSELGIVYLNRQLVTINDRICVLGTTLWSNIPKSMDSIMTDYLRDNRRIKDWSPAKARQEFHTNYNWLRCQLLATKGTEGDRVVIVVTHHAPLIYGTSKPQYLNDPKNCGYSSDCSELMPWVDYWIFGHTHYSVEIKCGKCQILANQKGKLEETDTRWQVARHFHC